MSQQTFNYPLQAYTWASIALAMPIFIWPIFLCFGFTPEFGVSIEQNWLMAMVCMLMASVVADSIWLYDKHYRWLLSTVLWVMLSSFLVGLVIQQVYLVSLLAYVLAFRALLMAAKLVNAVSTQQQWQWVAWWRDSSSALVIFLWLSYWPA